MRESEINRKFDMIRGVWRDPDVCYISLESVQIVLYKIIKGETYWQKFDPK